MRPPGSDPDRRQREFLQRLRAQHGFLRAFDRLRARRALFHLGTLLLTLPQTSREMPHHPAQPAGDTRRRRAGPAQSRDPGLLREIVTESRIPHQSPRQRAQPEDCRQSSAIGRASSIPIAW
jgi:hypothetical protein